MITVRVKITEYNKESNTCKAELLNGDIINLDPFVSCAIDLTDGDYHNGRGADIVGKSYLLTKYSVTADQVTPDNGGMIELT